MPTLYAKLTVLNMPAESNLSEFVPYEINTKLLFDFINMNTRFSA